jgi:pSer/pThr/pTyr-binding forkhead associated (FHA) protein/V8-like Glu-specific endopeptidase
MKIAIEHLRGAHAGRRLELAQPTIRLGRAPDNDVRFDPERDRDASGYHAEIRLEGGAATLRDLGSSNGTLVNGRRVGACALRSNDVVECGAGGPALRVTILEEPRVYPRTVVHDTTPPVEPAPLAGLASGGGAPLAGGALAPESLLAGVAPAAAPPVTGSAPTGLGPPPSVAAMPLAPGQKVGSRTVAMMINAALVQAQQRQGIGRGTQFLRSVVSQAVSQSTRRFKVALLIVLGAVLLGGGAGTGLFFRQHRVEEQTRRQLVAEIAALAQDADHAREEAQQRRTQEQEELRAEREQERAAAVREREELGQRIGTLTKQLAGLQSGGVGSTIASGNRRAVYLLTAKLGLMEVPVCTGFAIGPSTLATNAHCVAGMKPVIARGATVWAVTNGSGNKRFQVTKMGAHPRYRDLALGNDVGLMKVGGRLPRTVKLATTEELRALKQGQAMYVYGFPGDLAKPQNPEATITQGIISRIMTPEKTPGKFEDARILQHTAYVSGGTSGSPIFDANGTVIAVNAGGFRTTQQVVISSPTGGAVPVTINMAAPGYNFGMRVDLLQELMSLIED